MGYKRSAARVSVYEKVTAAMIEALEAGTVPWRQTWKGVGLGAFPANLATGKAYRGVNVWSCALSNKPTTASRYWVTYRQAQALKGNVRKGEKSGVTGIIWKFPTEEEKAKGKRPFASSFALFHVSQCDGLEENKRLRDEGAAMAEAAGSGVRFDSSAAAESTIGPYLKAGPSLSHGADGACYIPSSDAVRMPSREAFDAPSDYYSVLFHELTHSTGHRDRLAREGVCNAARFGSHEYSGEELIAEMGASYLRALTGIDDKGTHDNSAAYLAGWIKSLKGDPKLVLQAAGKAQKAVDLISGESVGGESEEA